MGDETVYGKNKCTAYKLRIVFYLADKTVILSPGHSISDNSKRLLQRGKGGIRIYGDFCSKDKVVRTSEGYC